MNSSAIRAYLSRVDRAMNGFNKEVNSSMSTMTKIMGKDETFYAEWVPFLGEWKTFYDDAFGTSSVLLFDSYADTCHDYHVRLREFFARYKKVFGRDPVTVMPSVPPGYAAVIKDEESNFGQNIAIATAVIGGIGALAYLISAVRGK